MVSGEIQEAIKRAECGIAQYLEIMELFPGLNVADDRDFQRKYNAFSLGHEEAPGNGIRHTTHSWSRGRYSKPTLRDPRSLVERALDRCEASFAASSSRRQIPDGIQLFWGR